MDEIGVLKGSMVIVSEDEQSISSKMVLPNMVFRECAKKRRWLQQR